MERDRYLALREEAGQILKQKETLSKDDYLVSLENFLVEIQKNQIQDLPNKKTNPSLDAYFSFENLANYMSEIIWVEEPGKILFINKAFEELFEISRHQILDNNLAFLERIHPEDISSLHFDFYENKVLTFNYRIKSSKKNFRHIHVKNYPVSDNLGNVLQRIGIAQDVTPVREKEQELIQTYMLAQEKNKELEFLNHLLETNEKKYQDIFMEMANGFALHEFIFDKNGKPLNYIFLEVNPAFEKLTGFSREQLLGKSVLEVMPDTEKYWINAYAKVIRTRKPVTFENYSGVLNKYFEVTAFSLGKSMFAVICTDITDRKLKEQSLKEKEEKFRSIVHNIPVALGVISLSGEFIQVNSFFERLFGYAQNEVRNLEMWLEKVYPDDKFRTSFLNQWIRDIQNAHRENTEPAARVCRLRSKRNEMLDIEISFRLIEGRVLTVFSDLTERIRFENELRALNKEYQQINQDLLDSNKRIFEVNRDLIEAEEKHRTILDTMADGVLLIGANMNVLSYNQAAIDLLKLEQENLIGKSVLSLNFKVIRESGEPFAKSEMPFVITLKTGVSQNNVPLGLIHPNNGISYVSINTRPLYEENKLIPIAVICSFTDITKKIEAERAIAENDKLFKNLNEVVSQSIGEKFFEKIIGCLAEAVHSDFAFIGEIQPSDPIKIKSIVSYRDGHIVDDFEYSIENTPCQHILYSAKGKWIDTSHEYQNLDIFKKYKIKTYLGIPIKDSKGKITGVMVVLYRKQIKDNPMAETLLSLFSGRIGAELERLKIEKDLILAKVMAEESDRLKSAFLANMSHEIRTPMNGILGFANLLNNDKLPSEKRQKYVEIINSSANQLLTIISDILDISKIESGILDIRKSSVKPHALLEELYSQFTLELKNKENQPVKLKLAIGKKDKNLVIETDEIRLKQILANLIGNAIKYTFEGFIEFGYKLCDNAMVEFYVKDTGIGISKENLKIIFERFRQVETSRLIAGTGLGLSISKGLVEILGGKIWVESELNRGTTFYFTLPMPAAK